MFLAPTSASVNLQPVSLTCHSGVSRWSGPFACSLAVERNTSSSIVVEECHRHIPQTKAKDMTTRCSTGQNEKHGCKWWCGRKHVFALVRTSEKIDHKSPPHLSWSFFCESNQALFQILLPRACSSLTSSYTSNSNMLHRAVVHSKLLPVNFSNISLTQLIDQRTHVQAWTNCSHFILVIGIFCTARCRADLHWLFATRTGWLCTGLWD